MQLYLQGADSNLGALRGDWRTTLGANIFTRFGEVLDLTLKLVLLILELQSIFFFI